MIEAIGAMPDQWQIQALRALRYHGRVSIAACHGPGKDALAAWFVLWVMYCFPNPKIPCTAPTAHQLYDLLWSEIAKWRNKMPKVMRGLTELKTDRFEFIGKEETWFAVARTARKENSEALQGFHAETIAIVVDEASGVPTIVFEVLEGAMTGARAMQLLIANPTQTTGYFYDSHHSDRGRWVTMRIMAHAAHKGEPLGAGVYTSKRVSPAYVEAMRKKYGEESNVFRVRVLGLFPKSEDDQVIPLEWVEAASARELYANERGAISIGGDVARFGDDDSAAVVREGRNILHAEAWHGNEIPQTTGRFIALGKRYEAKLEKGHRLYFFIDTTGLGAGVADNLREYIRNEQKTHWVVIDVDAGSKSPDSECHRMRDALWWRAREWFRTKQPAISSEIEQEVSQQLTGELASPKYNFTGTGEILVESKKDMKKRGVASPNLADALIHTFDFEAMKPEPPKKRDGWRDTWNSGNDWMTV